MLFDHGILKMAYCFNLEPKIVGVPRHINAKLFRSAKEPFFCSVIDDIEHIACPPRDKVIELAVDRDGHQIACSTFTQLGSFIGLNKSSSVPSLNLFTANGSPLTSKIVRR